MHPMKSRGHGPHGFIGHLQSTRPFSGSGTKGVAREHALAGKILFVVAAVGPSHIANMRENGFENILTMWTKGNMLQFTQVK